MNGRILDKEIRISVSNRLNYDISKKSITAMSCLGLVASFVLFHLAVACKAVM